MQYDSDTGKGDDTVSYAMKNGYAYELEAGAPGWRAKDDYWETVCYTATGAETLIGMRNIDGSRCAVFLCPTDGLYRAQMAHMCHDSP